MVIEILLGSVLLLSGMAVQGAEKLKRLIPALLEAI